jgi:hypothetical protein
VAENLEATAGRWHSCGQATSATTDAAAWHLLPNERIRYRTCSCRYFPPAVVLTEFPGRQNTRAINTSFASLVYLPMLLASLYIRYMEHREIGKPSLVGEARETSLAERQAAMRERAERLRRIVRRRAALKAAWKLPDARAETRMGTTE